MNKKGFTLVEMIVVVAIIAIMGALIVPTIYSQTANRGSANEGARSAYYAVQQVVSEVGTPVDGQYTLFYLHTAATGGIDSAQYKAAASRTALFSDITNIENFPNNSWEIRLQNLYNTTDKAGYIFVVVDEKGRVESGYFSEFADYDQLSSNNFEFTASGVCGDYRVGAFPARLAASGCNFKDSL